MNIADKFNKGKEKKTYTRIDSDYKVNIFLGYSEEGNMSMVIAEPGKEKAVQSSKKIDVSLKRRADQKMALTFDLLDGDYSAMFMYFCKDIIAVCERGGSQMAIVNALARWKYWRNLFGKRNISILGSQEIKGLIAELLELKDIFIKQYGVDVAIKSWMGPLMGHKDFEINDTWYEIKAVRENALQVSISSLEQLDSDIKGHLVLYYLEDTSMTNAHAINLNQVVMLVADAINDPEIWDLFWERLSNIGYIPTQEYDNYNYEFKDRKMYEVRDNFPRISRGKVPAQIGNAKYTILLDGIGEFKES